MSDRRRQIAERHLQDTWTQTEATDEMPRDSLYHCEECAELVLTRGQAAMAEYAAALLEEAAENVLLNSLLPSTNRFAEMLRARATQERAR